MPTQIRMADYGDFVYSPDAPVDAEWLEYIKMADRLLKEDTRVRQRCRELPFSAELAERKRQLDAYVSDYAALYRDKYTIGPVERDARFLHVSEFLARCAPVRDVFSVLHCNLNLPLHTVRAFEGFEEIDRLNAALTEDTPLRWWRNGPMDRPCYLFGPAVWELKSAEVTASDDGLALLFVETADRQRSKKERLTHDRSSYGNVATLQPVPKDVRVAVFRRDHGKCAACGGHEQLDFRYVVPPNEGGDETADNVRLLCEKCRGKQGDGVTG